MLNRRVRKDEPMDALISALLPFLVLVESGGDPNAIGDNGLAVGILQIHPVYLRDVNRILDRGEFELEDRLNPERSMVMATIYLRHYGTRYRRLTGKEPTFEVLARIHNGGPDGWKNPATVRYWKKVRDVLCSRRNSAKDAEEKAT